MSSLTSKYFSFVPISQLKFARKQHDVSKTYFRVASVRHLLRDFIIFSIQLEAIHVLISSAVKSWYDSVLRRRHLCEQQCTHHLQNVAGYMASCEFLRRDHHACIWYIFYQITNNGTRRFANIALPYTSRRGSDGIPLYRQQRCLRPTESAAVYHSDDYMGDSEIETLNGVLSAAVAYHDGLIRQWVSSQWRLPTVVNEDWYITCCQGKHWENT